MINNILNSIDFVFSFDDVIRNGKFILDVINDLFSTLAEHHAGLFPELIWSFFNFSDFLRWLRVELVDFFHGGRVGL